MAERTSSARGGAAESGRRGTLTREAIVDSAVALVDAEGTSALTLRRLGKELGVDPTAFYRHFPDKDSLVLAVGDHVTRWTLKAAESALSEAGTWQDHVRALADAWWLACRTFPGILSLTAARTTGQEAERAVVELLLGIVEPLGLDRRDTVLTYRMIADVILGLAGNHAAVLSMDAPLQEKDSTAWSRIYSVQRRDDFPATHRHLAELIDVSMDDIFAFSMDTVIRGIETRIAAASAD